MAQDAESAGCFERQVPRPSAGPPIAVSTLGSELSYGVVMAEVEVGPRRVDTMKTLLARGQISARPSPANYIISDVWWNRSHFERFWPRSRVLSL